MRANAGIAFQGSNVLGMGFVLTSDEAQRMLDDDGTNADVIFPYINGEDLNSDPEQRPSRWVINFWDWPEERARSYEVPWRHVYELVRPERGTNPRGGSRERWWQHERARPALYHAIGRGHLFESHPKGWDPRRTLRKVLACSLVSKHLSFAAVDAQWIYAHRLAVFATDSMGMWALLSSSINDAWARKNSSSLETRLNYAPSDAFETLPLCDVADSRLNAIGTRYEAHRRQLCISRGVGLTELYNRFNASAERASDFEALRELHRETDASIARAYGWADLDLGHGFHDVSYLPENDRERFTISERARLEVLRRLGELNRKRYEEEQASAPATKPHSTRGRAQATAAEQAGLALIEPPAMASKTKAAARAKRARNRRSSR